MSDVAQLGKESIKSLGAGAYLVTGLPSVVLVLSLFALYASRLYPWANPVRNGVRTIDPGFDSVVHAVGSLGIAGGIVLVLAVLMVAVFLRPLQIFMVQLLEGYWGAAGDYGWAEKLSVERHLRRFDRHRAWARPERTQALSRRFDDVAAARRYINRAERRRDRGDRILQLYPSQQRHVLGTQLGNILAAPKPQRGSGTDWRPSQPIRGSTLICRHGSMRRCPPSRTSWIPAQPSRCSSSSKPR